VFAFSIGSAAVSTGVCKFGLHGLPINVRKAWWMNEQTEAPHTRSHLHLDVCQLLGAWIQRRPDVSFPEPCTRVSWAVPPVSWTGPLGRVEGVCGFTARRRRRVEVQCKKSAVGL